MLRSQGALIQIDTAENEIDSVKEINEQQLVDDPVEPRCRLQIGDTDYSDETLNAFALATQTKLPRAYHLGFESFLKNNPNTTLYVFGNLEQIDERFTLNGYKVKLVPLNFTDLQNQLKTQIPEIDQEVFQTAVWRDTLLPLINSIPMILSDFVRLSLLFLYGGSWIDADAIYLRPFTMKNALPCYDRFERIDRWVQCDSNGTVEVPFRISSPVIPDRTLYCTNGILGNWKKGHPFLKKALLQMASAFPSDPILTNVALGGNLLVATLVNTEIDNGFPRSRNSLLLHEWPLLYRLEQLFGFWAVEEFSATFNHDLNAMLQDLSNRRVFSVQLFHNMYESASIMESYFLPGTLMHELWQRNCVFSCSECIQ